MLCHETVTAHLNFKYLSQWAYNITQVQRVQQNELFSRTKQKGHTIQTKSEFTVSHYSAYEAHLATAPQHIPTQHDMLPQHLVCKYELNCE